jgi:hypothetical protein
LRNTKVTLTTTSFVDNLPATKVFDNLSVNSEEEISIKFQVPPNLQSVNILIEAEVNNISKGKKENLSSSHSIQMNTNNNTLNFYECYLRKLKDDYYFYVLGKNGEPLSNVNVSITFSHRIFTNRSSTAALHTDDDGKIKLGPLSNITSINTNVRGPTGNTSSNFTLNDTTESVCLPYNLNILEDEEIQLPFICNHEFSQSTVNLVRYTSSYKVIENCFNKIKFTHEKGYQYGKLNISGLQRGHYTLSYNLTGQSVSIRVHKGVYWETDSFILKDHSLVEKRERNNIIRIKDISIEEEKENHRVSFNLEDYGKRTRAHVYAFTFIPPDLNSNFQSIENVNRDYGSMDVFPFAKWKNIFLSNRKLGDEFRYVFDRKFLKRFIGNTLDRPQLLLNRLKLRETQFDQEVVNAGNVYEQQMEETKGYGIQMQSLAAPSYAMSNMAPMMEQQQFNNYDMMCQNIAPMAYGGGMENAYLQRASNTQSYTSYQPGNPAFKSFQNFLSNSACVMSNLEPDKNGHVECTFDANKYSTILILALDDNTVSQSVVDITSALEDIERRDLSLSNPLSPEKYYNEMRNTEQLRKDESHAIEDITSTDYLIIDSLEKVQQVQTEINKATGQGFSNDLSFLKNWHKLDEEEKKKKYSQYMCHEVNLFLYFKDPAFFASVIHPFITNKMEKAFIDHWLLSNHAEVLSHCDLHSFNSLHAFEKCLLISTVVQKDKQEAQRLAHRMKLSAEQNEPKVSFS